MFIAIFLAYECIIQLNTLFVFFKDIHNDRDLLNFKYIESPKEKINEVGNYILEKEKEGYKVYILDFTAAMYMIPLNKYNKNFDMFMKGNFGINGETGLISDLNNAKENTVVLILQNKYGMNWQTPLSVVNYIRDKWKLVDQVSKFDVYIYE